VALGATISQRITDLIGSEYATIPSLSYKDLIVAAFNEVADMVSVDILLKYSPVAAQQLAADVTNGYNVEDKKILLVLRRDGDSIDRACSALTLPEYNAAKDTSSIYQATKFSPVYTIDSNNATGPLRILPDCTDTEKGFIYYFNYATNSTDLTGIDSAELHSVHNMPSNLIHAVVLKSCLNILLAYISEQIQDEEDVELMQMIQNQIQGLEKAFLQEMQRFVVEGVKVKGE
jgi:hypothetical protein